MRRAFDSERIWASRWLFDAALPLWWEIGADRVHGGFVEKIGLDGRAGGEPKRIRVQARQVFTFAQAGKLGWTGAWKQAVAHGLDFLRAAYLRDDGIYRKTVTAAGDPHDDGFDLYDQAFVLLALAAGYEALDRPIELRAEAARLLALLGDRLAHPIAGFEEDRPARLPLRSNPHMHMLEALLAWVALDGGAMFETRALEIVALARERLIDPLTGAVGEYYDAGWAFLPDAKGAVREPGHQFEWAYLLGQAGASLGGDHREAIARLAAFGTAHGIDRARQVAMFSLDAAGAVTDASARLWSQTEWLRTALVLGQDDDAAHAFATLRRFLDVPVPGLWRDRMLADGGFVDEPAPASSFYHVMTALIPLLARSGALA